MCSTRPREFARKLRRSHQLDHGPRVFSSTQIPAWTSQNVPANTGSFWAPDIAYFNNLYHLYYSVSSFGSQDSAIGLATSPTLNPADPNYLWTDHGPVIQSNPGQNPYNAIDPAIIHASDGRLWMSFGSFWNGIYLTELDPATGKRITSNSTDVFDRTTPGQSTRRHRGPVHLRA